MHCLYFPHRSRQKCPCQYRQNAQELRQNKYEKSLANLMIARLPSCQKKYFHLCLFIKIFNNITCSSLLYILSDQHGLNKWSTAVIKKVVVRVYLPLFIMNINYKLLLGTIFIIYIQRYFHFYCKVVFNFYSIESCPLSIYHLSLSRYPSGCYNL